MGSFNFRYLKLALLLCLSTIQMSLNAQNDTIPLNPTDDGLNVDFGISRNRNKYLWPVLYREKTETSYDLQLAFTLYRKRFLLDGSYDHSHLLPLYWKTTNRGVTTFKLATLYYPSLINYTTDSARQYRSLRVGSLMPSIDLLNVTRSRGNLYVENNFFFFIFSKTDSIAQKSHFVVFPLYWQYANNQRKTMTIFPLLRIKRESTKYLSESQATFSSVVIYPLLSKKSTYLKLQYPTGITWEQKKIIKLEIANSRWKTLLFYNRFQQNERREFVDHHFDTTKVFRKVSLFSLIYLTDKLTQYERDTFKFREFNFYPLIYHSNSYEKFRLNYTDSWKIENVKKTTIFPVFYSLTSSKNNNLVKSRLVFFPIYWRYQNQTSKALAVLPLFRFKTDSLVVLNKLIYKYNQSRFFYPLITTYSKNSNFEYDIINSMKNRGFWRLYISNTHYNTWLLFSKRTEMSRYETQNGKYDTSNFERKGSVFTIFRWKHHIQNMQYDQYLFDTLRFSEFTIWPIFNHFQQYQKYQTKYTINYQTRIWNQTTLFPLLFLESKYLDTQLVKSRCVVFPLYWQYQKEKSNKLYVFPFWYNENSGNDTTQFLFPLYYSTKTESVRTTLIFPSYYQSSSSNFKAQAFFPLYYSYENIILKEKRKSWLFWYWYFKRESSVMKNGVVLDGIVSRSFLPFFHYEATENGDTNLMACLLYYTSKNKWLRTRHIFPLYTESKTNTHFASNLFPLYWYSRNSKDTSLFIFPLFYSKNGKFTTQKMLLPVYYHFKHVNNDFKLVAPFYLSQVHYSDTLKMISPFYWRHITGSIEAFTYKKEHFTALVCYSKFKQLGNNGYERQFTIPLLLNWRKTYIDTANWVASFPNSITSTAAFSITPLLRFKKDLNFFYVRGTEGVNFNRYKLKFLHNRWVTFFPFIYYHNNRTQNVNFDRYTKKLISDSTYKDSLSYSSNFTFFPIYYVKNTTNDIGTQKLCSRRVIFPLFWYYNKKFDFNVIWRKSIYFMPLWGRYEEIWKGSSKLQVDSQFHQNKVAKKVAFITPFYWSIHRFGLAHNLLFPLFSYKVENVNSQYNLINDFLVQRVQYNNYIDSLKITAHLLYVLYRYKHENGYSSHNLLYPLIHASQDTINHIKKFRIAPIFWSMSTPNQSYQYLIPLYGYREKDSSVTFNLLLGIYRFQSFEGQMRSHRILYGIIHYDAYSNGNFETRWLYKLYANVKLDSVREKSIFPLMNKVQHKNGNYRKSYLAGIYAKTKTKISGTNEYYLEEKLLWFFRYRSNLNYLKSKGITVQQINNLTRF